MKNLGDIVEVGTDSTRIDGGRGPIGRVLLCLDGSTHAEEAIPYASTIAAKFKSDLELAFVLESGGHSPAPRPHDALDWQIARAEAEDYLSKVASGLDDALKRVTSTVLQGRAADQLISHAEHNDVDLLVLTTHGENGPARWTLGSTAERLVGHAPSSVLVVPLGRKGEALCDPAELKRVLVLLDGSPRAESVLPLMERLAQKTALELVLLHVTPKLSVFHGDPEDEGAAALIKQLQDMNQSRAERYLKQLSERVQREGCAAKALVMSGDPRQVIPELATREEIDLVVLTAHGRTGDRSQSCGQTASHLVRHVHLPVLIFQNLPRRTPRYADDLRDRVSAAPKRAAGSSVPS